MLTGSDQKSLSAQPVSALGRGSVRAFRKNRVCREEGCGTVLSIYNADQFCSQHLPRQTVRVRGRA
jgi:hypothetical protein